MGTSSLLWIFGLLALGGLGFIRTWQASQAGRDQAEKEQKEKELIHAKEEIDRLSNRPRTAGDRLERLRRWRDYVSKAKNVR